MLRSLALAAAVLTLTACGDDAPAVSDSTTVVVPDDAAVRLAEAEARRAEAEARVAELEAARDDAEAPTPASPAPSTPSTAASPAPTASAPTAPASRRPGLTGLPPARNSPELFSGTKTFRFCETYRQSAVARYQGMELCYEGTVRQDDDRLIGEGRKTTENDRALTGAARTPLRIEGYVYDDYTVRFNYTVQGERRVTRGSAALSGDAMNSSGEGSGWSGGTFQSDAANSSGEAFFFVSNPVG